MRMLRTLFALIALVASCSTLAAWVNKAGQGLPESPYRGSNGEFIAQMIFIGDEQELFREWNRPAESVNINDIDSISINAPISIFVVFGGCQRDPQGNCNVVMRFRVLAPDGAVYTETPAMEVWRSKPAPPGRALQLSADYLKIIVEPHEQRGKYVANVEVRDINSGRLIKLVRPFTASEFSKK